MITMNINSCYFLLRILPLLAAAILSSVSAATVEYDFKLKQLLGGKGFEDTLSPDCSNIWSERRWLYLANEALPGPTIEATEGDTIRITVHNENEVLAVTIHWHGMHQNGTVWNDGTSQITQCSLNAFESQTYEFVAYPPGTHYWHSHQGMTAVDGITGPIIIHPKEPEPFEYDEERMVFLMDFFDETSVTQSAGLMADTLNWIGSPDSLLLNGKGLATECRGFNGTQPYETCLNQCPDSGCLTPCRSFDHPTCLDACIDTLAWTPSILVEKGKTYRFRVINAGGLVMQNFAIANHTMTIVEVEGTIVDPLEVSNLTLAPGQRYSVLVTADQDGENFWMHSVVAGRDPKGMPDGRYVLSYANTTDDIQLPPIEDLPAHPLWDDNTLFANLFEELRTKDTSDHPSDEPALIANDTDINRYVITLTQGTNPLNGKVNWALNNVSFVYPERGLPLIFTAFEESERLGWPLDGPLKGTIDLPRRISADWNFSLSLADENGPGYNISETATSVIRLNEGEIAEFIIDNSIATNGVSEFHPWHFHGHSYWVVGRGEGPYNEERDVPNYNLEDPVLRDTTVGLSAQWVALRFVANNPGVWYFHCHIESHLDMGMGFVVIVSPDKIGALSNSVKYCDQHSLQGGNDNQDPSASDDQETVEVDPPSGSSGPIFLSWIFSAVASFVSFLVLA